MPDVRPIADISTGRLLARDGSGAWFIQGRRKSRPLAEAEPIALIRLLERSWNDLAASLNGDDARAFRDDVAPRALALALEWPTDYWVARALAWVEAEPVLVEHVQAQLRALAEAERKKGRQNIRHRARRLLRQRT